MTRTLRQRLLLALDSDRKGAIYLTVRNHLPSNARSLTLAFADFVTVEETGGFERTGEHQWSWDERTREPWLRTLVNINRTNVGGVQFVDTGSWAIVNYPPINASWRYSGEKIDLEQVHEVSTDGLASSDGSIAYIGPHRQRQFHLGNQRFRFAIPAAASLSDSLEAIRSSLDHAAKNLDVGGRNDEVVVVAAPSTIDWSATGLQSGANGFWVVDSSSVSRPNNTWVHEYVHTRQEWDRHSSTEWLIEGTTNFYAALFTFQQGRIPFSTFYRHVSTNQHGSTVLADPESWTAPNAHYTKGRRVTAALDAQIRQRTDGRSSFEDVFRRTNTVDGRLTTETFKEIVASVGGDGLRDWIETYVEGPQQPDVPEEKELFAPATGPAEPPETGDNGTGESEERSEECPVCGNEVGTGEEFCDACGTTLFERCPVCAYDVTDEPYCPECGTEIIEACDVCGRRRHESERYCQRCGTEF